MWSMGQKNQERDKRGQSHLMLSQQVLLYEKTRHKLIIDTHARKNTQFNNDTYCIDYVICSLYCYVTSCPCMIKHEHKTQMRLLCQKRSEITHNVRFLNPHRTL